MLGIVSFFLILVYIRHVYLANGSLVLLSNYISDLFLVCALAFFCMMNASDWIFSPYLGGFFIFKLGALMWGLSAIKSPYLPLGVWLLGAMSAPTPVSALVHSSTLVTAGYFFLFKFMAGCLGSFRYFLFIYMMGSITFLMRLIICGLERDVKKIIALSTMCHMALSISLLCISQGGGTPSFYYILYHAFFKSFLFLLAGYIFLARLYHQDWQQSIFGFLGEKSFPLVHSLHSLFYVFVCSLVGGMLISLLATVKHYFLVEHGTYSFLLADEYLYISCYLATSYIFFKLVRGSRGRLGRPDAPLIGFLYPALYFVIILTGSHCSSLL